MTRAAAIGLALALAGCCASGQSIFQRSADSYPPTPYEAAPPPAAAVERHCPPFRAWSKPDLAKLAAALKAVPADTILMRMALDWRRYYGDAKVCRDF